MWKKGLWNVSEWKCVKMCDSLRQLLLSSPPTQTVWLKTAIPVIPPTLSPSSSSPSSPSSPSAPSSNQKMVNLWSLNNHRQLSLPLPQEPWLVDLVNQVLTIDIKGELPRLYWGQFGSMLLKWFWSSQKLWTNNKILFKSAACKIVEAFSHYNPNPPN